MSADSVVQLTQARTGVYGVGHPPVMAFVWHFTDRVVPGPFGMLLLQNAVFWGALALLASLALRSIWSGPVTLLIGCWPPVFALLGTIWKDVHLGAAFLLGMVFLVHARARRSWVAIALSVPPLIYATAVRPNGATALVPLVVFAAFIALEQRGAARRLIPALFIGLAGAAVLTFAGSRINRMLAEGQTPPPFQGPLLHDLVAISLATGEDSLPRYLEEGPHALSLARLRPLFNPYTLDPLFYSPKDALWVTSRPQDVRAIHAQWWRAVRAHPSVYLRHRWLMMRTLIGLGGPEVWYPFHIQIDPNPYGITLPESRANRMAMAFLNRIRNGFTFRAFLYLVALIALGIAGIVRRPPLAGAIALSASGLGYVFPYFFIAPAPDFRYCWWAVICAMISPLVAILDRRHGGTPHESLAPVESMV